MRPCGLLDLSLSAFLGFDLLTLALGLLPLALDDRYLRIDGLLVKNMGSDDLDDATDQNIRELEIFAEQLIRAPTAQEALDRVADMASYS